MVIRMNGLGRGIQAIKRNTGAITGLGTSFFNRTQRRADGCLCLPHFGCRHTQSLIKTGPLFD